MQKRFLNAHTFEFVVQASFCDKNRAHDLKEQTYADNYYLTGPTD